MTAEGLDLADFFSRLNLADKTAKSAAVRGVGRAASQLLNHSMTESPTVPKVTGDLRGSGFVAVNGKAIQGNYPGGDAPTSEKVVFGEDVRAGDVVAEVGFNRPQAARLHEHPEYNFSEPGSGGKYLETPLKTHASDYARTAADTIKKALE